MCNRSFVLTCNFVFLNFAWRYLKQTLEILYIRCLTVLLTHFCTIWYNLCFNFPFTHERSLLQNLRFFPWRRDEGYFKAWRQGRTSYTLVDAGMREIWATGWIHNQIWVVVSSFCVKFLHLPWTWGMKYFWDTLLDADIESDVLGWQYISGSFRVASLSTHHSQSISL